MNRHLIIGNGGAALSTLRAIRSLGNDDEITLVSQESCPAYSPVLTPYYISGRIAYSALFLCQASFYRKQKVNAILGKRAVAVEPASQRVRLEDGQKLPYDELLIATGSTPVVPAIPGAELGLTLWTARDAQRLKAAVRRVDSVAVVGAGLIGIQVVDALLKLNKRVSLMEMQERVLPRVLDETASVMVSARLSEQGVALYLREQVTEVRRARGRKQLLLSSGARIEAGAVVFAIGVKPNVDFLKESGIRTDKGVVVDEAGRTNVECVFAAGDSAQPPDPASPASGIFDGRTEINATWTNAVEGGWVAGLNMAGKPAVRRRLARVNTLSPGGLPIVSLGQIGLDQEDDEVEVRRDEYSYRKLVFRGRRLVGALLVGDIAEAGILGHAIDCDGLSPKLKANIVGNSAFHGLAGSLRPFMLA